MPTIAMNDEVMRFVLPASTKERFQDKCAQSGQKMSERLRFLVMRDIEETPTSASRLAGIFASARAKGEVAGLVEPTIGDIDALAKLLRVSRNQLSGQWTAVHWERRAFASMRSAASTMCLTVPDVHSLKPDRGRLLLVLLILRK